jgi:hypothetical protein
MLKLAQLSGKLARRCGSSTLARKIMHVRFDFRQGVSRITIE